MVHVRPSDLFRNRCFQNNQTEWSIMTRLHDLDIGRYRMAGLLSHKSVATIDPVYLYPSRANKRCYGNHEGIIICHQENMPI